MSRTVPEAIRELCLSFPGTEEKVSHGIPSFKVEGKLFAYFLVNHHGDGRVALWLGAPVGSQQFYAELNPEAYFVPPYIGHRGWLGVELNSGLAWEEIGERVRDAWQNNAPAALLAQLRESIDVEPPNVEMSAQDVNPMLGEYPRQVLAQLAECCLRFPETSANEASGSPGWKAGKKIFVRTRHNSGRMKLLFWVGIEMQSFLTGDPRYAIPMYLGSNGWIELDVQGEVNWEEVESMLQTSYRHFALKRMLNALDG